MTLSRAALPARDSIWRIPMGIGGRKYRLLLIVLVIVLCCVGTSGCVPLRDLGGALSGFKKAYATARMPGRGIGTGRRTSST